MRTTFNKVFGPRDTLRPRDAYGVSGRGVAGPLVHKGVLKNSLKRPAESEKSNNWDARWRTERGSPFFGKGFVSGSPAYSAFELLRGGNLLVYVARPGYPFIVFVRLVTSIRCTWGTKVRLRRGVVSQGTCVIVSRNRGIYESACSRVSSQSVGSMSFRLESVGAGSDVSHGCCAGKERRSWWLGDRRV